MNILIMHNAYRQVGGEDFAVSNEAELLANAGHRVTVETVDNRLIPTFAEMVRTARPRWWPMNLPRRAWMAEMLERLRIDIVHVHNFFPLLTPAVHAEAYARGLPVIQTLHNYRLFCAAATFERDGKVCELCLHKSRLNAVRYRCYHDSALSSAAVAAMQYQAVDRRLLTGNVDRFVALTEFARSKLVEGGLAPDKVLVKPNFLDRPRPPAELPREGALFVGRISKEKGLRPLVEAWHRLPGISLTIIGDGPLRAELESGAPANVRFVGRIEREHVEEAMRRAAVLIMPSLWYEGLPMTLVEAFANGLPAIVSRLGSLAEIVDEGETGDFCAPGDVQSIADTVNRALADRARLRRMGARAREIFEEKYSPHRNLELLEAIYADAMRLGSRPR